MRLLYGFFLPAACVFAQTSATVGAGFTAPAPVSAAPGQILTFFVSGLGVTLTAPVRAPGGKPLPSSLAGISASLRQGGTDQPVPLLDVRPVSTCPAGTLPGASAITCATLTAVTVQIPYELVPLCPLCARPVAFPPPWIYFSYNGLNGTAIELNPLADQVHILTVCDVAIQASSAPPPSNITGLPCAPLVTHSDGSMVSASNPAAIGEELVAWATGLGATNPAASTGQPPAGAAPTAETFSIDFNFTPNALPVKPWHGLRPSPVPAYTGLVAGMAGLYQINFVVPPQPGGGTPRCALAGTFAPGANVAQSNLTVSIGGGFSFDGAGICAATLIPVD